ncbi:MAG: inositol monophosphatase family protein [Acidimicrobiales bacterium]
MLERFDTLADELRRRLDELDDWGLSGNRPGQYVHDVVADELLLPALLGDGFAVLTEESGLVAAAAGGNGITVVVDPIDGSTNASHRLPWYATSLCAVDADGPLVAHVSNLATGERFRAIRGEGVVADRAVGGRVATGPSAIERLDQAIVAFSGLPPEHGGWRQYRAYGAFALDLCAVATGSFDACADVDRAHGVWDYLGGMLICAEAEVPVVDAFGDDLVVIDHDARRAPVAAATPELLAEVVAMRRRWGSEGGAPR